MPEEGAVPFSKSRDALFKLAEVRPLSLEQKMIVDLARALGLVVNDLEKQLEEIGRKIDGLSRPRRGPHA
jgi:hypothetical protein